MAVEQLCADGARPAQGYESADAVRHSVLLHVYGQALGLYRQAPESEAVMGINYYLETGLEQLVDNLL